MTCIYALTKINYTYQIPLLIGITCADAPATARSSTNPTRSISNR